MTDLLELRRNIDEIDRKIIHLLAERFTCTEKVGVHKAQNALPLQDHERESLQFQKIAELSGQMGLKPEYAAEIYRCIMDLAISRHRELRTEHAAALEQKG